MPIENEFKYPLRLSREIIDRLEAKFPLQALEQGYLSGDGRVRRVTEDGASSCWFTYKQDTEDGPVEIEAQISKVDFNRLWPTTSNRLSKTRFSFKEAGVRWDVDFFGTLSEPYFAMAEAEVPKGASEPAPCALIADHVVACVGRDKRFTSKKLANREHAQAMLAVLHGR